MSDKIINMGIFEIHLVKRKENPYKELNIALKELKHVVFKALKISKLAKFMEKINS